MKKHIEAFDTLRGAAALAVFLGHMDMIKPYCTLYEYIVPDIGTVVTMFFVLSGVVITVSQYDRMKDGITRTEYTAFVQRRLQAVYPVYIVTTVVGMIYSFVCETISRNWSIATVVKSIGKVIFAVTLTQSLIPRKNVAECFNGVAWYLSTLFLLWLITPWLLRLVKKLSGGGVTVIAGSCSRPGTVPGRAVPCPLAQPI